MSFEIRISDTFRRAAKTKEQVLLAEIYDKSDYASVNEDKILKNLKAEGFDL